MQEFNNLKIEGEYKLVRAKQINNDIDVFIRVESNVLGIKVKDMFLQIRDFTFMMLRTSKESNLVSLHFFRTESFDSDFFNFDVDINKASFKKGKDYIILELS